MSRANCCYRAKWLIPVNQPPIENGLLSVAEGRIVAVGENLSGAAPIDLGDVALAPGLVNAHTHLEFSDIDAPLGEAGMEFPLWIQQVVGRRRAAGDQLATQKSAAIAAGIRESKEHGVVAFGEITTMPYCLNDYAAEEGIVPFLELIGATSDRLTDLIKAAIDFHTQHGEPRRPLGISPHAPYSVHRDIFVRAVEFSASTQTPLVMHLAESREELELLDSQTGLFRDMLEKFGIWRDDSFKPGTRPLHYLRRLAQSHHALVIHGNYLVDEELQFLAERPTLMTLVYCPRTHEFFRHDRHPLGKLHQYGAALAIGTDSRASSPDLALWRDVQLAAAQFPEIPPEAFFQMVSVNPAKALGIADRFGSLQPGASGQMVQFALPSGTERTQLFEAILEVEPQPVGVS